MKKKILKYLEKASLLTHYIIGVLLFFTMFMVLSVSTIYFTDKPVEGIMFEAFIPSLIFGLVFGTILPSMVGLGRNAVEFYKITKPLMERAEKCNTREEWESIVKDIAIFYGTHKRGKDNTRYLNSINRVLEIKKEYMK